MVKSAQAVTVEFTTANPSTGAAVNADGLPTGMLYVDGAANAAAVTVTNVTTGVYKAAVMLPALIAGQVVGIRIAATVAAIAGQGIVWQDVSDTALASDVPANVRTNLATELGRLDAAMTTRLASSGYTAPDNAGIGNALTQATEANAHAHSVEAKTTNLPASPAATGAAMTLTAAYDRAKDDVLTPIAGLPTDADVNAAAAAALASYDPPTRAEATADREAVVAALPAAAPLATANASAVRTNLAAELARIDENVSAAKTLTVGERASIASAVSSLATTGLAAMKTLIDAVLLKTNLIGAGQVIVHSPITVSGTITVEQGDSYPAGRNRAIDVNVDDPTHAMGLDALNVVLYLQAEQFTWTASSVTSTTGGYRVRFTPTITQTAGVTRTNQGYKLKACIDNLAPTDDDAETIARGKVIVKRDLPRIPRTV